MSYSAAPDHNAGAVRLPSSSLCQHRPTGVAYLSGAEVYTLVSSQLKDASRSILDEKDSTDWGRVAPLLDMAARHPWFLAVVAVICAWGLRLVLKALYDAAGGVGLAIREDSKDRRWIVVDVQEGGAAAGGGIEPGDTIESVDGIS